MKSLDDRYSSPSRLYVIRQYVRRLDQEGFEQSLQTLREEAESNLYHLHLAKALAFDLKNSFYLGICDPEKLHGVPAGILREIDSFHEEETFAAFCARFVELFSRSFKKAVHMDFLEYHSFLRIDDAKRRLTEPDASVATVALAVGYQSVATFIRRFRQVEGITPGTFQRLLGQNTTDGTK